MADAEARAELRRLCDAAAGRLLEAGLSWDEVVAVIRGRLGPVPPPPPEDLFGVPVGGQLRLRDGQLRRRDPDGPGGATRGTLLPAAAGRPEPAPAWHAEVDEAVEKLWPSPLIGSAAADMPVGAAAQVRDGRVVTDLDSPPLVVPASAGEVRLPGDADRYPRAQVAGEPGEPPVGSVVTDTRSRVCWREDAGWHRAGTERPLAWRDVCQAVGGAADPIARPGQPTIVSQPPQRAQQPMLIRPAGSLELPMQVPVLDGDGQAMLGSKGQPLMRTETESVEIREIVPADGRP